jgi:hypothetical protein
MGESTPLKASLAFFSATVGPAACGPRQFAAVLTIGGFLHNRNLEKKLGHAAIISGRLGELSKPWYNVE